MRSSAARAERRRNGVPFLPPTDFCARLSKQRNSIIYFRFIGNFGDMSGRHELDQLKERGAGIPASDAVAQLYENAFHEFGSRFLWSRRASEHPTFAQALTIADCLRREGNLRSRAFAAHIEEACRATLLRAEQKA